MQRDAQVLIVVLGVIAAIGAYVLFDGKDGLGGGKPVVATEQRTEPPEASGSSNGPKCVEMVFLDEKGIPIPVDPPFIGILIGAGPLFEGSPPPFAKAESGRSAPCPDALVASSQKTFDDFCRSTETRMKAAADNNTDIATVVRRCADLSAALGK